MPRATTDSAGVALKIELSGDFFKYDPGDTLYRNIRTTMGEFAAEMERAVQGDVEAHAGSMPYSHGFAASRVKGYVTSAKTGKHWATWAAVGIPSTGLDKAQAIRLKAEYAGRHKPRGSGTSSTGRRYGPDGTTRGIEPTWHPFRRVKSAVYRMRAIASANLTKGME